MGIVTFAIELSLFILLLQAKRRALVELGFLLILCRVVIYLRKWRKRRGF